MRDTRDRGVSPVIATVLLVAVVVVIGATVGVFVTDLASQSRVENPRAALTVEQVTFTEAAETDPDYKGGCAVGYEVGFEVTLRALDRADRIYVIVRSETGERLKTVWDEPTVADVGTTKFLANEDTGNAAGVDVDIGRDGSDDWALCPDESATLEFYGQVGEQTWQLTSYEYN